MKTVYNFAYRPTRNYDDANDVAQDAFYLRVFQLPIQFVSRRFVVSTWLFPNHDQCLSRRAQKNAARTRDSSLGRHLDLREDPVSSRQIESPARHRYFARGKERGRPTTDAVSALPDTNDG